MKPLSSLTVVSVLNDDAVNPAQFDAFAATLAQHVTDFDVVLVANAVSAELTLALKSSLDQMPDTTVVFLGQHVHDDLARLVGIEHAVGDYVLFCDMTLDDPALLPPLLRQLHAGYDLVVSEMVGGVAPKRPPATRLLTAAYTRLYAGVTGIELELQPTGLRVMSRAAALFLAGWPNAELLMRARSLGNGFPSTSLLLEPGALPARRGTKRGHSWSAGVAMLLSVSTMPMRGATYAALFGGAASAVYGLYIFAVYLLKPDVASGWTTISLQLSGMMLIFSIVLLFISEYIIQIHSASPPRSRRYLVVRELRSPLSRRSGRLNIVDADGAFQLGQPDWLLPAATPQG